MPQTAAGETLAKGVTHEAIQTGDSEGVDLIDVAMPNSAVALQVGAEDVASVNGSITAVARTPDDWLSDEHVVAAVNGGYFGADHGDRKEIVGLLVTEGRVRHAAPPIQGSGSANLAPASYVRSAFGIMADGTPRITWAATRPGAPQTLYAYPGPILNGAGRSGRRSRSWHPDMAIGCGPSLIHNGVIDITDRLERLVNPMPCPRTFVAYGEPGGAQHFVMGIASSMTYRQVAEFLVKYFADHHYGTPWAAMCLDGGASTQMSYRAGGTKTHPRYTGVTVADCLMIVTKDTP